MPLTGLDRFTDTKPPRRGGPLCPPAQDGVVVMDVSCVADSKLSACAVDASRSCRSRRYPLTPLTLVTTLSAPGPLAQHSTARRGARFSVSVPEPLGRCKTSAEGRAAVPSRTGWRCCDGCHLRGGFQSVHRYRDSAFRE
jgi:hypothetical protein